MVFVGFPCWMQIIELSSDSAWTAKMKLVNCTIPGCFELTNTYLCDILEPICRVKSYRLWQPLLDSWTLRLLSNRLVWIGARICILEFAQFQLNILGLFIFPEIAQKICLVWWRKGAGMIDPHFRNCFVLHI